MLRGLVLCALVAIASANWPLGKTCPPPGFDSVKKFDPAAFISTSWYVQAQTIVAYQGLDTFYCVVATYEPVNETDILQGLTVYNYANKDKVNGEAFGTSGSGGEPGVFANLTAIVPDAEDPSKLLVGLSVMRLFIPEMFLHYVYGPYWVVAVGEDEAGEYEWAIISAGAPEVPTPDGCKTGYDLFAPFKFNGVGLWLFSRNPVDPAATREMKSVAKNLGFDISGLIPVEQEGCEYIGAILK